MFPVFGNVFALFSAMSCLRLNTVPLSILGAQRAGNVPNSKNVEQNISIQNNTIKLKLSH